MGGFAEKKDGRTPQEMSESDLAVYREQEKSIKDNIAKAQIDFDTLNDKINSSKTELSNLNANIAVSQSSLNELNSNFQSKKDELAKFAEDSAKDRKEEAEALYQKAVAQTQSNTDESFQLSSQKADQENAQRGLDASITVFKNEKEAWTKTCAEEVDKIAETKKQNQFLVKENQGLLADIVSATVESQTALAALEDRKASNQDIDKKITENNDLLKQIADGQAANEQKAAELAQKEANLTASAVAQDNTKNQIQLRQEQLDQKEEDLRNRERVCAEKEASLTKGA